VGTKTNRAAIGARIAVTVHGTGGATRTVYRTVNSGGSFGASPLRQHIGLGAGVRSRGSSDPPGQVDVEITWPVSKTTQRFANVPPDTVLRIREGDDRYTEENRRVR
jgi:hypothetical protein